MENNPQELETKTSNKDLWLFLIVLDVIFLCVFGFFLYKYFAARVVNPAPATPAVVETETVEALPEVGEEVVLVSQTNVVEPVPPLKEEIVVPEPKPQPAAEVKPQPAPVIAQPQTVAKQSIVVAPAAANSKYRRVTFKWFGEGEKVSLVSGFTNRKPQVLKKVGDHWETTLSIAPGTYKFLYVIDGKNTLDPYAEAKDGRSLVVIK